ncbi:MAG: HDOD domain-containing protein [Fimbriimonadaceae bacterium]
MITRLVVPSPEFESNIRDGLKKGIYTDEPIDFPDLRQAFGALDQALSWEIAVTAGLETLIRPMLKSQVITTREFMRHALATAAGCGAIAEHLNLPKDKFIIAGLYHNIGIPVLINSYPDVYAQFIEQSTGSNILIEDLEQTHFGFNHEEVGSSFLISCTFPDDCWRPAATHHLCEMTEDILVASVRLCSNIAHQVGCTLGLANGCNALHPGLISGIGLNDTALAEMANRMAIAATRGAKFV